MATFWEIAACSVSNLFSLYFVYLQYLFISRFGFKSGICLLIAPVPVHCFSITFTTGVGSVAKEHADSNINVVSAKDPTLQQTAPPKEGPQHKTQGEGKVTPDQHYHQTQPLLLTEQTVHTQIPNQEHSKLQNPSRLKSLKGSYLGTRTRST